jgi:hypothetical protein
VGRGNVVHYNSTALGFCRFPVAEAALASFAQGRAIWVRAHREPHFESTEVTRRARSRLGEHCYRILSNNCEHFCEWCLRDEHRSYQVESLLALPRKMARVCGEVITRILTSVACAPATNDRTAD